MRTKQEIETEIAALKALKPISKFKENTERKIELAIEELEHGYDDTAEEWNELNDSEQDIVNTTTNHPKAGALWCPNDPSSATRPAETHK